MIMYGVDGSSAVRVSGEMQTISNPICSTMPQRMPQGDEKGKAQIKYQRRTDLASNALNFAIKEDKGFVCFVASE